MESNSENLVNCRYCDEKVSANAKKCKHCGEILDPQMRELEFLKKQRNQQVFMNGGGSSSSSSASSASLVASLREAQKVDYPWGWHLILSVFTWGLWIPIWILLYVLRDKTKYH
jgi:hypothetical protein